MDASVSWLAYCISTLAMMRRWYSIISDTFSCRLCFWCSPRSAPHRYHVSHIAPYYAWMRPLIFLTFASVDITVPLELPIVTREHFNRWYSIKAYYFAMTFADLPIQILCVTIFVAITYTMTAQPLELFRIALFYVIICLVTLVSQGWGMITGAVCGTKVNRKYLHRNFVKLICVFRLFSRVAGTTGWTIRDCTVYGVFGIFSTLCRCPSVVALALPHFIFETWAGRGGTRSLRLWSTENGMWTHLLSVSMAK